MKRPRFLVLAILLTAPACAVSGSGGIGAMSCGNGTVAINRSQIQLVVPPDNPADATVQVNGLSRTDTATLKRNPPSSEEWQSLLRITVAPDNDVRRTDIASQPAVAGSYHATHDAIVFKPMFAFDPGRRYRAEFDRAKLPSMRGGTSLPGDLVDIAELSLPKTHVEPTTIVDHVYPTSDRVPENQLRLYIH